MVLRSHSTNSPPAPMTRSNIQPMTLSKAWTGHISNANATQGFLNNLNFAYRYLKDRVESAIRRLSDVRRTVNPAAPARENRNVHPHGQGSGVSNGELYKLLPEPSDPRP